MNFIESLDQEKILLLDGAMGTQLANLDLPMGGQNNIDNPDAVSSIHKRYVDSGCHILITNTLTMNRIYIESHKLDIDVREVNLMGVKLARAATGNERHVLGDMGASGKILEPFGELSESDAFENYKDQAAVLAEGMVDGFIIETMIDLREALCAVRACKAVSELPIAVSMAFNTPKNGGRTIMGDSATDCARALTEAGAAAIGANCGNLDPSETAEIISIFKETTSLPLLAQPNAGKPKLIDNNTCFDMSPSDFAQGISKCLNAGARLLGGCCGTSPEHISAAAHILNANG